MGERLPTVLIAFALVLNSTQYSNALILAVVLLLCFFNRSNIYFKAPVKICFLLTVLAVITLNFDSVFDLEGLVRLMTLSGLILFYPFRMNFSRLDAICLFVVFFFLLLTHLLSVVDLGTANALISQWYPIRDNVWRADALSSMADIVSMDGRFGGIFYNPNIMGQSMVFLYMFLSIYLIYHQGFKVFILILLAALLSIVLTGSRSALAVFIVLSIFNLRKFNLNPLGSLVLFFISLLLLFFLDVGATVSKFYQTNRIFSTFNGASDTSLSVKFTNFLKYLDDLANSYNYHLSNVFFGNFELGDYFFDADYGYIFYSLGAAGVVVLASFFVLTYRNTINGFRYFYFIFLISLSATVIINFRFSILLFLLISFISQNNFLGYNTAVDANSLDRPSSKP